jgi:hypothetical protein
MMQFNYFNLPKESHLNDMVILLLFVPSSNFTFILLSETCVNFNNEQVISVTLRVMASRRLRPQTSEVGSRLFS